MPNDCKVFVHKPYPNYVEVDLLIPSHDGFTTNLGPSKGHFFILRVEQVIFCEESLERPIKQERVGSIDPNFAHLVT